MIRRKPLLALAGALAACAGCSAGAAGRLAIRPEASPAVPPAAVARIVEETNLNAEQVRTFYAETNVSGQVGLRGGNLEGYVALEQPKDFSFKLSQGGLSNKEVVDLGSNQDEFWFWVRNNDERAVFVGEYGSDGAVPTGLPFQPDWIVEALGLRPIPESESARLQVERGDTPGTIKLTHVRDDGHGGTLVKQTILDEQTQRVVMHRYFARDHKTEVARVVPSEYVRVAASEAGDPEGPSVVVPQHLEIDLRPSANPRENIHLKVQLRKLKVNASFPEDRRTAWFTVPKYSGYQTRRLFADPVYAAGGESRRYESRPAPPSGARLGDPQPFGVEDSSLLDSDPDLLGPDLPALPGEPAGESAIVRPGIPQAPGREDEYSTPAQASRPGPLGSGFLYR
jgi:hypothetical protein